MCFARQHFPVRTNAPCARADAFGRAGKDLLALPLPRRYVDSAAVFARSNNLMSMPMCGLPRGASMRAV